MQTAHLISMSNPDKNLSKLDFKRAVLQLGVEVDGAPPSLQLSEQEWLELASSLRDSTSPGLVRLYQYALNAAAWMRVHRAH